MKILTAHRELAGDPPMDPALILTIDHDGTTFEVVAPTDQRRLELGAVILLPLDEAQDPLPWGDPWSDDEGRETTIPGMTMDPEVVRLVRANLDHLEAGTWAPGPVT